MEPSSVTCWGVGDGWPSADRQHAAFLYRLGAATVLIDCGEAISHTYRASGLSYDDVEPLCVSHLHFDHVGGLFMLLQGCWLEQRRRPLHVYLPADGIPPIRQLLRAACLFDEVLPFPLRFEPLRHGQSFASANVHITPFAVTHLHGFRRDFANQYPQGYEAFCFRLEAGPLRLGHSADIGAPADLAPLLEQPLDLLVCELAHVDPEELFRYLKPHAIRRLALVHLSRPLWDDRPRLERLAADLLPHVPCCFPLDGQLLSLNVKR